jgi:hypothetical protein
MDPDVAAARSAKKRFKQRGIPCRVPSRRIDPLLMWSREGKWDVRFKDHQM